MVDWSAAGTPKTGKDSIWIAHHFPAPNRQGFRRSTVNPATRQEANAFLIETLGKHVQAGRRVLLGFDFSLGYPQGLTEHLGCGSWLELLRYFQTQIIDSETNKNNRYEVAARMNAEIGDGPGPFWGCHQSAATDRLTSRRIGHFEFPYRGLAEFRETERSGKLVGASPQSCWKLGGIGAVGSQTLLGLKHVADLRFASSGPLRDMIRVWPFESGCKHSEESPVTIAEIFPSSIPIAAADQAKIKDQKLVRDQIQVLNCVRWAADLDRQQQLAQRFECPTIGEIEGWILC